MHIPVHVRGLDLTHCDVSSEPSTPMTVLTSNLAAWVALSTFALCVLTVGVLCTDAVRSGLLRLSFPLQSLCGFVFCVRCNLTSTHA
jgi:hypothetical protein